MPSAAPASETDPAAPSAGEPPWSHLLRGALPFHSTAWAATVAQCYGFEDCSIHVEDAMLPLFLSRSPLFGRKLSSAVYNSYAGPLYRAAAECAELVRRARATAVARGATLIELKALQPLPAEVVETFGLQCRHKYRLTVLPLRPYSELWAAYSSNFRSHLRKARNRVARAGVRVARSSALADVHAFHDLLMRHYRNKHRMIGQPRRLFTLLHRHCLSAGSGDLWVARAPDGALAGGLLLLTRGPIVTACFGASHDAYAHLSIDAILKDETIHHYSERGLRLYDLGLSSPKQASLLFAKSRFPGVTLDVPYYFLSLDGAPIPDVDFSDAYMGLRRPFRYVPVPVAKLLSSMLVRYLN